MARNKRTPEGAIVPSNGNQTTPSVDNKSDAAAVFTSHTPKELPEEKPAIPGGASGLPNAPLPLLVRDETDKKGYVAPKTDEPPMDAKAAPIAISYIVLNDIDVVINGMRQKFKTGKICTEGHYNIAALRTQGVRFEEKNADNVPKGG